MKLQNNFTTPEQSKRLLELGVPADSADCYYGLSLGVIPDKDRELFFRKGWSKNDDIFINTIIRDGVKDKYIPCWSVGRLIEIIRLCHDDTASLIIQDCTPDYLVEVISCQVNLKHFDFSKLEE